MIIPLANGGDTICEGYFNFAMLCLEALWYDMKEIYEIRQLQFAIIKRYTEFL